MALLAVVAAIAAVGVQAAPAMAQTGGVSSGGTSTSSGGVSGTYCTTTRSYPIIIDGNKACAPQSAPQKVKDVIQAANVIRNKPYKWGGGHGSWSDSGYDCSGAVSYALHAQGETGWLNGGALASGGLAHWGYSGKGAWITVFANSGHTWLRIGQPGRTKIRWDTSGTGGSGPSWHRSMGSSSGYRVRHPNRY
jgi:hypothetical protein